MEKITEICNDKRRRRRRIRDQNAEGKVYGMDYVDVSDDFRTLTVYFLGKAPKGIKKENVRIDGGRRIRNIQVTGAKVNHESGPERDDSMQVKVDKPGDFSTYTLRLVSQGKDPQGNPIELPFEGFDVHYATVDFSFTTGCSNNLDCLTDDTCPPTPLTEPETSYLAKDYASFRQLLLDRLALVMPDWNERHIPDLGITLVELLAYIGDYLSYYQDAVATEAYLETARQRISVRRHVRLVDYSMHEGCNARTWVSVKTSQDLIDKDALDPTKIYFIAGLSSTTQGTSSTITHDDVLNLSGGDYEVFEPITKGSINLYKAHNIIDFYTWGDEQCCLPRGATSATLRDHWEHPDSRAKEPSTYNQQSQYSEPAPQDGTPTERKRRLHLHEGDFLIFEERVGPKTGVRADADPSHRHVVRLTKVAQDVDELYDRPVVEIEWAEDDALPFPLCISAIGPAPDCKLLEEISIARGNAILVDSGRRIVDEPLGSVETKETILLCEDKGHPADSQDLPVPFNPSLKKAPLTFSQPLLTATNISAAKLIMQDPRQALPQILELMGTRDVQNGTIKNSWMPQRDLLESKSSDYHFVVEMDNDGYGHLRFGDGELGRMPEAGTAFTATYRVGNGPTGNVGAGTISYIVFRQGAALPDDVRLEPHTPLPARGGTPPEPLDEIKLLAPHTFRTDLQRAITADDYARLAERNPKVQRAAAMLVWTGSWYDVLVAIDPLGREQGDKALLREIRGYLHRYRRIGHDVQVVPATYVPLNIRMVISIDSHYLRGHVKAALLALFSNRVLPGGQRGFFHSDNLTFGQGIALSKLVSIAQAVPGVESVYVCTFERLFDGPNNELQNEFLPIGPMEIAMLDNDPSFSERGNLVLDMRGGR